MKEVSKNRKFSETIKNKCSPNSLERRLVSEKYEIIKTIIGQDTFISGSYGRYTAISPVNDIDIIFRINSYIKGEQLNEDLIKKGDIDLHQSLFQIEKILKQSIEKIDERAEIRLQSHSINIQFSSVKFGIDLVPAIETNEKNNFGDNFYKIPELIYFSKAIRKKLYETKQQIRLIKSDPKGYLKEATILNEKNPNYRKVTKYLKKWKDFIKLSDNNFQLKSFHIEQVVVNETKKEANVGILKLLFNSLLYLLDNNTIPTIQDRANSQRYIDDYIKEFPEIRKKSYIDNLTSFLVYLEEIGKCESEEEFGNLLESIFSLPNKYNRHDNESFLFDQKIRIMNEPDISLRIDGKVLAKESIFYSYYLSDKIYQVNPGRKIRFKIMDCNCSDKYNTKWKVKNYGDEATREKSTRGEITDDYTKNNPENAKYIGNHYVECYCIVDKLCIKCAKIPVIIKY